MPSPSIPCSLVGTLPSSHQHFAIAASLFTISKRSVSPDLCWYFKSFTNLGDATRFKNCYCNQEVLKSIYGYVITAIRSFRTQREIGARVNYVFMWKEYEMTMNSNRGYQSGILPVTRISLLLRTTAPIRSLATTYYFDYFTLANWYCASPTVDCGLSMTSSNSQRVRATVSQSCWPWHICKKQKKNKKKGSSSLWVSYK